MKNQIHVRLKSEIRIATKTAILRRQESLYLFRIGSRYMAQAAIAEGVKQRQDLQILGSRYIAAAALAVDGGGGHRRHMHLAAAMLNGKTYHQCEQKCRVKPSPTVLADIIRRYLATRLHPDARETATRWLTEGGVRLSDLKRDTTPKASAA